MQCSKPKLLGFVSCAVCLCIMTVFANFHTAAPDCPAMVSLEQRSGPPEVFWEWALGTLKLSNVTALCISPSSQIEAATIRRRQLHVMEATVMNVHQCSVLITAASGSRLVLFSLSHANIFSEALTLLPRLQSGAIVLIKLLLQSKDASHVDHFVDVWLCDRLLQMQQGDVVWHVLQKRTPFNNPTMDFFLADRKSTSYANTHSTESYALLMTIPTQLPMSSLRSMLSGVSRLRALDPGRDVNVFLVVRACQHFGRMF